jgi:3-mercaptopyruvate sulfurtransferase SseA
MRRTFAVIAALGLGTVASAQLKTAAGQTQTTAPAPAMQATATPAVAAVQEPLEAARRIPIAEARKLVAAKKAVFVDVRGTESYNAGHIKGALNIPGFELVKRVKEIPRGRMIIAYCA